MKIDTKLNELGVVVPNISKPLAAYVPGVKAGEFIYVSGQLPIKDKELLYSGKIGQELSVEAGKAAAEICVINCLAVVKNIIGSWENLDRIIKISVYVQSSDDFFEQAVVANGASELLEKIFGEKGKHARLAVGVNSLPLNAACEVEMIAMTKKA